MITINVFLKVKEECRRDYLRLIGELVQASLKEDGCQIYKHGEDTGHPNEFVIIENWESQASLDAHNKTAHFQKFANSISPYLSEDFVIKLS